MKTPAKTPSIALVYRYTTSAGPRRFPAVVDDKGIKLWTVMEDGREWRYPGGAYQFRYRVNGRQSFEPVSMPVVPVDRYPLKEIEKQRQMLLKRLQAPGGVEGSHGTPRSLKEAIRAYTLDLHNTKRLAMERQAEYALKEWKAWPYPTRQDVLTWFKTLCDAGLSEKTLKSRYVILKHFLRFHKVMVPDMPPAPKVARKRPRVVEDDAVTALLASCDGYTRVLIEMGRQLGLRKRELMFAAWDDISWANAEFTVREKPDVGFTIKNRKERTLPMSPSLVTLLREWQGHHTGRFILGTRTGKPAQSLLNKLKAEVIKAELPPKDFTLHGLRRKYATTLHNNGVPLATVSDMLDHANISTTAAYLGIEGRKEQAAHVARIFG